VVVLNLIGIIISTVLAGMPGQFFYVEIPAEGCLVSGFGTQIQLP